MTYEKYRKEFTDYYFFHADRRAEEFCQRVLPNLDAQYREGMSAYQMKALQYRVIAEEFEPVIFAHSPFYCEMGMLSSITDGARDFRGTRHAGGWTCWKKGHLAVEQDRELYRLRSNQGGERLYLICGTYYDGSQHFNFNYKPVLQGGLVSLYEKATAQLDGATDTERDYLEATRAGLLALKKIAEKFADAAEQKSANADDTARANLSRIADSAQHCPWNAPRTFYEALNTLAFFRSTVGALEGVGFNTFGRPDVELLPFYEADLAAGRLTKAEAYDLITVFLLSYDCRYDHDMKMVGYGDHEFENTYTLGGCDKNGVPVWNDLTEMFLRATARKRSFSRRLNAVFPQGHRRHISMPFARM